jgi:hypothetical protein
MPISDSTYATQNALVTAYIARATYAALHTADTATSGNELTGTGSARGAISWGTITNGVVTGTATCTLPTAGGSPKGVGVWTALTGGSLADGQYNTTDVTYPGPGTAAVTFTYTQS